MALTLEQLKKLIEGEDFKYFVAPDRPAVMLGARGACGRYHFVVALELDGRFLHFRSLNYLHCPADHPHLTEVLKVIGEINFRIRMVKLGWDPSDGEIVAEAELWVWDGTVTQGQFQRMIHNYLPVLDTSYGRLSAVLETGKDPGEGEIPTPGGSLPPELRELLERLRGAGPKPPDEDDEEVVI